MVIQTEVTLQADNVLAACDGEKIKALQKLLFDQLTSVPVFDDCKY